MNTYTHICETNVFNLFLPVENSQFGGAGGLSGGGPGQQGQMAKK